LYCINDAYPSFTNNTFVRNSAVTGSAVYSENSVPSLQNCIVAYGSSPNTVFCWSASSVPIFTCCDIFGNTGGDWVGCIADQAGTIGNFSADPLFCDTANGDFKIHECSPCAPENNGCGLLIGAEAVGCDCCVIRGDINHDGHPTIDISDLNLLIEYMFLSGTTPQCYDEADVDHSDTCPVDISDLIYLIDFMFVGGPEPLPCQ